MAEIPTVKQLTNNMRRIAALPQNQHPEPWFRELARVEDETDAQYRLRALEVIGRRWDRSANTVRSMQDGGGHCHGKNSFGFLRDLQKYGACQFNERTGALVKSSLDGGPDPMTYLASLPARKRPPARPSKKSRRSARA